MKPPPTIASEPAPTRGGLDPDLSLLARRHLRFGWWSLLIFLALGIALETLHAFKAGLYLDVSNSTRRLMWTLAHAHGTLLGLVHVAFGATAHLLPAWKASSRALASACLTSATLLIPSGFFLGGLVIHSGDPGLGILLTPPGALLLLVAVFLTARAAQQALKRGAGKK